MPGEKDLHPYQKFCVDFLEEKPQCALFLDCGLGKTIITLTAISHLLYDSYEVSRVLIIAPLRVARDTWIGELSKWEHLKGLRMERILGTPKERVAALSRKAELYVINRENVEWLVKHYAGRRLPFDMLVIDELSSFKNSRAKRFLALKKVLGQFSRVQADARRVAGNGFQLPAQDRFRPGGSHREQLRPAPGQRGEGQLPGWKVLCVRRRAYPQRPQADSRRGFLHGGQQGIIRPVLRG